MFIAIALSLAEAKGAEAIYLGINAVDYSGYPDCRPEYLEAYQQLAALLIGSSSPKLALTCSFYLWRFAKTPHILKLPHLHFPSAVDVLLWAIGSLGYQQYTLAVD